MKRKLRQRTSLIFILVFNLMISGALKAADATSPQSPENHFKSGLFEASLGGGALFSPFVLNGRPTLDYSLIEIQLGYMLTDPVDPGSMLGNLEFVSDAFGGGIFDGRGNYVSGATFWLRYNFVRQNCRFAPFAQFGAGVTETDLDRRLSGENFNFNLGLGIGARYFLASNWSLNLEYRYQHISNAYLSKHDLGVNADGPMLSISYFF